MHVVAAPDKFRGSLSAAAAASAIADAARSIGASCTAVPLADGGEGTLVALGGANRVSTVTGPLGQATDARWRLELDRAVIEAAQASGLTIAGGRDENRPVFATSRGTGELIDEAIRAGAREIVVGVGGVASTDGGLGAVEALRWEPFPNRGVSVVVACDVRTRFEDAASRFGPQKGASPTEVILLRERLLDLSARYRHCYGTDLSQKPRAGAAGGLAGGLAALGARLVGGFDLIADRVGLSGAVASANVVVTAEGFLDASSFLGKVVGGVARCARRQSVPVVAIVGDAAADARRRISAISLVERYGAYDAWHQTGACVRDAARQLIRSASLPRP